MAYDGYAGYGYEGGSSYGPYQGGYYGGLDAVSELAGPNSSAYERTYSAGAGTQTSFATEDASGNVSYHDTSTDAAGGYSDHDGSFSSNGGYFGSAYYGYRYSTFSMANDAFGDSPETLSTEQQLDGPGSYAYDRASSTQFGTETDYAQETSNGSHYQHQTLSYGSPGTSSNYFTATSYDGTSGAGDYSFKTYAETGTKYNAYGGTTTSTYQTVYNSAGGTSEYGYSTYLNGSHEASVYETGSPSYRYSVYTNAYGASYPNGSYGSHP